MNVFDYLFDSKQNLEKDFVLGSNESISFKTLYYNALIIASYLKKSIGKDKNVLLLSENSVFFITAYLAILKSGNVCIPLSYDIEQDNLSYILELSDSKVIFTNRQETLIFSEGIKKLDELDFREILKEGIITSFDAEFSDSRLAEIIFTSGSTGMPKGVMISHRNIITNTNSIVEYLKLTSNDIVCVVLPFYYCYGLSLLHTHLRVAASVVLNNTFMFLGSVIKDLKTYSCTGFSGVPSHFQILLKKSTSFKNQRFPQLRYVTQAGGKLDNSYIVEFVETFSDTEFYVMYGQTEATARLSYLPPEQVLTKLGSIGRGIPGVTLKIVKENGQLCNIGEQGELIARGENIMLGYFKDPKATNTTLRNGWLLTGDLAYYDNDGYIYLQGRQREILKVRGKRISPKEIEEVILSVPEVIDCTVNGVKSDIFGEAIKATIVIQSMVMETELREEVLHQCKMKLSAYKIPQIIVFCTEMNLKPTGKKNKPV